MFTARGKCHLLQRSEILRLCLPSLTFSQAVVVSKQSLENWLARNQTHLSKPNEESVGVPEEISMSDILCEHGALDPSKASDMKCINEVSAEFTTKYGKPYHKIRVHTKRSWLLDAPSHHCSIPTTSVQFASRNCTKVRDLRAINRHPDTKFFLCVEKRYQQEHPRLVSTFNEVCEVSLDEPGFWISKPWLKGQPSLNLPSGWSLFCRH